MKKRVLSLFLALLMILASMPLTLLSAAAEGLGSIADDESSESPTKPIVSIEPVERYNTNAVLAKPDASGYVHLVIKAIGEITEDITVYYATEDISAIEVAGDYEAASGSVVLTKGDPEVEILIKTHRARYSITIDKSSYISRSFKVKLTGVSDNAKLKEDPKENPDANSVKCSLLAEHNLKAYGFREATVLAPYTGFDNYDLVNVLTTDPCDGGKSYSKNIPVNFPASWSADYVKTGIGAHLYMALRDAHIDESSWNSSSQVRVYIGEVAIQLKGEFHDNNEFGWGQFILSSHYNVSGSNNKFKKYTDENFMFAFWTGYDESYMSINVNSPQFIAPIMRDKYIIRRDCWYFGEPTSKPYNPGEFYIGLSDYLLSHKSIRISLESWGGYSRQLSGGTISFRLEDVTAPKIDKINNSYAIYHNFDTVTKDEKLRVAIRFNEPVQVIGQEPFFTGKVNNVGTGIEPHPYTIKFNYVGGSGTDTLYFESDYQNNYQINSITDIQFKYADSIKDFGGVANSFSPDAKLVIDGFDLDRRVPHISVSSADAKMNQWGKNKSITVNVSNISDGAVLYYSWTDKNGVPTFENSIVLNSISVNGTQNVTIFGEGDGEKYLHIKAVSKYGQEKSLITVAGTSENVSFLGPYRFDNTAPAVDEDKQLWPVAEESSLTVKKYSIPVPRDENTKNIELKMYYVDENGEIVVFKTHKFTEKDTKPLEIELLAADVGAVGDIIRREVTVYFTLTDEVGNTSENLGSHKAVFDTREYIKVGYAGSAPGFADKTDFADNGYVIIYNGDVQPDIPTDLEPDKKVICYSFEFSGIDNPTGGRTYLFINKNGTPLEKLDTFEDFDIDTEDHIENGNLVGMTVNFYTQMEAGYYDIYLGYFEGDLSDEDRVNGRLPDKVSETYRVYVGTGKGKLDEKVEQGTVLINKVYQLPSSFYFYYMDTSGTIGSIAKEAYNKTTLPASFSSQAKALEYVLFNEYRDLYAVTLTDELAEALNAGNSNARKALGETKHAEAGQVWIRYKRASWDAGKTPISSDWVFYYYGTTELLQVNKFSTLLKDALNSVAATITAQGATVALTDFSLASGTGNSMLDKLGAPYLAPLQMHIEDKRLSKETCNGNFVNEITFSADKAIYSSEVIIKDTPYFLVGNTVIPEGARFQYKRIDESGKEDENWTDITFKKDQRFRDVIPTAGRYKLRELGEGGVSVFNAYIDGDAPMVVVSWNDKDGNTKSQTLNKSSEKNFRAKSFRIIGIDSAEYDKYSYVALYNATNEKLYGIYMLTELQKSPVDIPDGNYYMVVADRSGNSYTMTLHLNSSQLYCPITVSENVKIKFTCDRKDSQIEEFYVKRNGVLVSGKYAPDLEFTESGTYEFYVRDIYGNEFGPEIRIFNRVYPEVDWKYRDESGHYVTYDPEKKTKYFTLESTVDGVFSMSTSVGLKFQIPDNYGFSFLGVAPEHSHNISDGTVTIKNTQAFQLKVYYKKHPEVYTVYNCSADTIAPMIEASVQVNTMAPDEIDELRQLIASGADFKPGSKLTPTKISYSSVDVQTKYLANKDVVLADFINVNVFDESGLAYVFVYLDGELQKELTGQNAGSDIVLSKAGEYRIVAEDALGNRSEFTFTNGVPDSFTYAVDGLPYVVGFHDYEKFDQNGNFTDCVFGNESVSFIIEDQMKVFYKITDSHGTVRFVSFDISDNVIREVYYSVDDENTLFLQTSDKVLFDGNDPQTVAKREYVLYELKDIGVTIYAAVNSNGDYVLTVYSNESDALIVEARLNTEGEEFYYTKTELSRNSATLLIKTDDLKEIKATEELVKINRSFTVSRNNFVSDKIEYVEVYYSNINDFDETGLFFKEDIYSEDAYYEEEGFYLVRLVNQYGNESSFIIHVSYKFDVASYTEFADGHKIHYSAGYKGTLYSNNKIVLEVYDDSVTVDVKKDGIAYKPVVTIDKGITYVVLSEPGSYIVSISDMYKNNVERSAEISFLNVGFREDLLTGYNENALKKDEGYTNQKLSINKAVLDEEKICYLAVQYGDRFDLLCDSISESRVDLDESKLADFIGSYGDGEYIVIARNRYGAVLTKTVRYRETPTLSLEREIRSGTEPEAYDINKAISIGFWSNSELIFKTDAEYYVFKVNGDKTECPKKLSFTSSEQQGRTEYDITYNDEYGFSYSFKAYLVRQELEIIPDLETEALNIDGLLTTTENIVVKFSENAYCTYTLNNSEEKVYTPGEKLSRDGIYRFVAVDHAGNMSALTIKKDTIVEFEFVELNSSAVIQSGGVVNFSKAEFKAANGDSAYIEKVFKNGILQNNFNSTKFSEDGKWEFVLSDKLGNKSYFCFYIVTKQKNGFSYTTPYEYRVTELWYDSGDGIKLSYLKFVNHNEFSSSFEFKENGKYTVVMTSIVTGNVSRFEFTINTNAPEVSLVGCDPGAATINDVTITGCIVGDTVKVYRATSMGDELVKEVVVSSSTTKLPVINEGGEYRIVVESEAGVATELSFVRKHVMNTEGSIFIMIIIGVAIIGLFVGLVYRNKSKTDK